MELFDSRLDVGIVVRINLRSSWEQTEGTVRLVVSYFNWIWVHSRKKTTAAMREGLAVQQHSLRETAPWSWHNLITYPTLI